MGDGDENRATTGRFLLFDAAASRDAWDQMERFTRGIEPADVAAEFERAIRGRGAFRMFRDRLHHYDLSDAWDRYEQLHRLRALHRWFAAAGFRLVLTDVPEWISS